MNDCLFPYSYKTKAGYSKRPLKILKKTQLKNYLILTYTLYYNRKTQNPIKNIPSKKFDHFPLRCLVH